VQVDLPRKGVQDEIPNIPKEGKETVLGFTMEGEDTAKRIFLARWIERKVVLNVRTVERETPETGADLERINRNEGVFVGTVESGPAKETYRGGCSGMGSRGS
jgi:hypothetical protein